MKHDQTFNRALFSACQTDACREVERLLHEQPSALRMRTPFGTWLHVAAGSGSLQVVEYLLSNGANPDEKGGTFGGSAINEAAGKGHRQVVRKLLEAGASLDTSEPERNPLFSAIYGGHIELVKLLVESGIDYRVFYTGEYMKEMDAIAFAQERGQTEISSYLRSLQNVAEPLHRKDTDKPPRAPHIKR
ncbi:MULTISPECIES: ankyrin repeat domain-containing protein [unclassified Rhizobacter]|uniref:ankyrin repeat domain-containing protein n=1 Tax=unclassified Rhizobacter TaxID=2640088 RepID=UPI0009E7637A|nr:MULTISPECIES: ankyrin repeat domain-containing protein [unclassified Rhizobacter]